MLFYAKHSPENFLNKWQLVEAERYCVLKRIRRQSHTMNYPLIVRVKMDSIWKKVWQMNSPVNSGFQKNNQNLATYICIRG